MLGQTLVWIIALAVLAALGYFNYKATINRAEKLFCEVDSANCSKIKFLDKSNRRRV